MKCIECNGLGITIFVEVWHDYSPSDKTILDAYICTACHGNGKQSLIKNLLWRYKYKDEVAEGGACLVNYLGFPPIAFGGVLNNRKSLPKEILQTLKTQAEEKEKNVKRPAKTI